MKIVFIWKQEDLNKWIAGSAYKQLNIDIVYITNKFLTISIVQYVLIYNFLHLIIWITYKNKFPGYL